MTSRTDRITQQRQEKLSRIRARGINPYPSRYHRSHTAQEAVTLLQQNETGVPGEEEVNVAGRIMANRSMGKISFLD
ncbi:lysine--tRNA ligase, partial [Chloroflexota bacterium]